MQELAAGEMSETSAIAESSYNTRDWIWSRSSECADSSRRKPTAKLFMNQAHAGIPQSEPLCKDVCG
jgi:hypothetical protein